MRGKIILVLLVIAIIVIGLSTPDSTTGRIADESRDILLRLPGFLYEIVFGPEIPGPDRDTIRIATWNVENWGKAKSTDPWKMEVIAGILSQYDLIAVQEISNIREQSDPGCPRNEDDCPGNPSCGLIRSALEAYLNEDLGLNYSFIFSPQIRDERYLYIYDPEKLELLESGLMEDPEDSEPICSASPGSTGLMVRQPFMARFRAGDFDFILLNVHTSPAMNKQELEGLEKLYREARKLEQDVIILGDLNADCSYLGEKERIALRKDDYIWVVDDDSDTTVGQSDCAYDRLIFTESSRDDFSGSWGISMGIPRNVSDHYPVWADFYIEGDRD